MEDYALLKVVHVACVVLSYILFFVRGIWLIAGSERTRRLSIRILPHVVDTILLASAIGLVLVTRQFPGTHDWLTAKVCALVLYIIIGMIAFRFARRRSLQIAAWVIAQVVFLYIVAVAIGRTPWPLSRVW
ncbi:MAG: SirB2 family protein [Gammaproteobacteria bacterium]|nr:SirB2 family protein [Gammaproteobacteria bacterium]